MLLPLVITLVVVLPLYQVLKVVVAHLAVMASTSYSTSPSTRVVGGGGAGCQPGLGSGCAIDNLTMGNMG
jgi:hypothetical protein